MAEINSKLDWNRLVDLYYKSIFTYCVHFLGDRDDANDAVQEVYLKAFRGKAILVVENVDSPQVKHWLYRIARNVCIDRKRWWKRALKFQKSLPSEELIPASDPISQSLLKMIDELPQKQREVFILRHWHGFQTSEVASLLGIEEGSVKSHLSRAIARLKNSLIEKKFS